MPAAQARRAHGVPSARARELARLNDCDDYRVVEYSESLNSSMFASQRTAEGIILLTRRGG